MDALISDITLFSSLPDEHKHIVSDTKKDVYKNYVGLLELFDKLNTKNINELINGIKNKIDAKQKRGSIIEMYGDMLKPVVLYILDNIYIDYDSSEKISEIEEIDKDDEEESNNIELSEDENDDENDIKFTWNNNQISGWNNAVNSDFVSGIHSQATGSGKSLMALKIMWEYHKKNPKHHLAWLCERKDIPQKLFFDGYVNNKPIYNLSNFKFWKKNDIIDMTKFTIKEYVYNKRDNDWVTKLNEYNGDKPLFVIINRAYLTTRSKNANSKYKYQELSTNYPKFMIIDECHSAMANATYKLLLHAKWNWKSSIQGLSATPYRKGKSYTTIDIDIDCPDKDKIKTQENENKLIQIFHKQGNVNELNILSWFNLKEAIEQGVVLEPVFHWFHIKKYIKKTKKHVDKYKNYSDDEVISVLTILNKIIELCKYKKCVVWCRLKSIANSWYEIFTKEKHKYTNLNKMQSYIDHSGVSSEYDKFYEKSDNAIMFCAAKFREGSDIPYLSCCLFLDKVKNRGELPFIQCIGRVLRKDDEGLKGNGHVLDGCTLEDDENKMKGILNKLLKYYLQLYEFSKSDFELNISDKNGNHELSKSKVNIYNDIMSSLRMEADKKKIYIDLKNDKKITLDLDNVDLKTMEWKKIIPNFENVLKNTLIMCEYEEFMALKKRVKELGIKSAYDYDTNWEAYRLYAINDKHEIKKIEPKKQFPAYFKNWYSFLDIDTSKYIQDKETWRKRCFKLNLTKENYFEKHKKYKELPDMPQELYQDFTNLLSELDREQLTNDFQRR